jgi:sugar phosphate isomerase/epimerase
LPALIAWAKDNRLGVIDVGGDADVSANQVMDSGLRIGSADLKEWGKMMSPDKSVRAEAVASNIQYVKAAAAGGAKIFFMCALPLKPERTRAENFADLVESLAVLAPAMEKAGTALAIEGYPGSGAIVTTPEGYRRLFKEIPSPAVGINFDPSHLLRMGIDPLRFLTEFAPRVRHVHGKDTEILSEAIYEFGTEVPATFAKGHGFGAWAWRYTIPGHGQTRWNRVFSILKENHYSGAVCIELEDENFNGSTEGEKQGILAGAGFLSSI